jgi:hypothetical protein
MVDEIKYGNPSYEHTKWLKKTGLAYKHFENLSKFKYPLNSSKVTIYELNDLKENLGNLIGNPELLKRYKFYDENIIEAFYNKLYFSNLKKEDKDFDSFKIFAEDVFSDINPLVYDLKYFFQRPRPYQLSYHYKQSLFPIESKNSNTPSYPSLFTIQANILSHILGNWYPKYYKDLTYLAKDIENSRLYMGLNYQSDIDFSYFVVDSIKKDKEFKAKYSL